MKLELKPGAYLTDSQIAAEVNISRTPVREAFYRLEHEGLLVNQARRGWRVYTLSLQDIEQIFDIKRSPGGVKKRVPGMWPPAGMRTCGPHYRRPWGA